MIVVLDDPMKPDLLASGRLSGPAGTLLLSSAFFLVGYDAVQQKAADDGQWRNALHIELRWCPDHVSPLLSYLLIVIVVAITIISISIVARASRDSRSSTALLAAPFLGVDLFAHPFHLGFVVAAYIHDCRYSRYI